MHFECFIRTKSTVGHSHFVNIKKIKNKLLQPAHTVQKWFVQSRKSWKRHNGTFNCTTLNDLFTHFGKSKTIKKILGFV